jgi:hypothetical protein
MLNVISGTLSAGAPPVSPTSYESIATVVGNGSATTLSFTSIPSTFKHLQIRAIVKTAYASNSSGLRTQFNSNTSSTYFDHGLYGDGASAGAFGRTSVDTAGSAYIAGTSATNVFGAVIFDILDYQNTNKNKTFRILSGTDFNGSGQIRLASGSIADTSAITSLTFVDANSAVAFSTGTSFALYGIKG